MKHMWLQENWYFQKRFVVLENEEGPSYDGVVDKETSETDLAKGQNDLNQ